MIEKVNGSLSGSYPEKIEFSWVPVIISKVESIATGGLLTGSETISVTIASFEANSPSEALKVKLSIPLNPISGF